MFWLCLSEVVEIQVFFVTTLQTHSLEMLVVVVVVVSLLVVCDSKLRHRGWRPTAEDETGY